MTRPHLPDTVLQAAAAWRTRHDAGLSSVEEQEFLRWLEADERHAQAFDEFDATWSALDRARELSPAQLGVAPHSPAGASPATPPRSRVGWMAVATAAAACLVLAAILFNRPPAAPFDTTQPTTISAATYKRVDLPDGSVARLNAGSSLAFEFKADRRSVQLVRGEAHFTVAKDAARPFSVEASGVVARAVGTAFSVARQANAVEVIVTEGRVQLGGATTRDVPELIAGDKIVVSLAERATAVTAPARARLSAAELASSQAWQGHMLAFDAAPLAEIIAQFNRHNSHQLVIDDAALAERRFGGSFRADDPEGFIALLATTAGIAHTRQGDATHLRLAR